MIISILIFVAGIVIGCYLNDLIDNAIEEFFVN